MLAQKDSAVWRHGILTRDTTLPPVDKLELWDETQIPTLWDEVTSDELDTESNRAEYPAAFRWCCCERLGDRPGCVRGEHEANPDRSKKGRGNELSDPEDDPLELCSLVVRVWD